MSLNKSNNEKHWDVRRADSVPKFICAVMVTVDPSPLCSALQPLMEKGSVKRAGPARARIRPKRIDGDKAYSSRSIRQSLRRRGIRYTIPRRSNEHRGGKFDKALYRQRSWVERCFNRLKQYRRIATRYEKKAQNYLAILTIASILLWL